MADIQITLDAKKAITDSERLDVALEKLEATAKSVQAVFKKMSLKNPILLESKLHKNVAFTPEYKYIKNRVQLHSKSNPILLYTKLVQPKADTRFKGIPSSYSGGTYDQPPKPPKGSPGIPGGKLGDKTKEIAGLTDRLIQKQKELNDISEQAARITGKEIAETRTLLALEEKLTAARGPRTTPIATTPRGEGSAELKSQEKYQEMISNSAEKSLARQQKAAEAITAQYGSQSKIAKEMHDSDAAYQKTVKAVEPYRGTEQPDKALFDEIRKSDKDHEESLIRTASYKTDLTEKAERQAKSDRLAQTRHYQSEKQKQKAIEQSTREIQKQEQEAKKLIKYAEDHTNAIKRSRQAMKAQTDEIKMQNKFARAAKEQRPGAATWDRVWKPKAVLPSGLGESFDKTMAGWDKLGPEASLASASVSSKKYTQEQINQLSQIDKAYDKIGKDIPPTMKDIEQEYGHLKARVSGWRDAVKQGAMTQDNFNKKMKIAANETKTLDKQMRKASKGGGLLSSTFGKLAIGATFIAATLFIFQELRQYITALVKIGTDYIKVLADIQGETGRTEKETDALSDTFKDLASGTVFGVKDMYGAYKELRNQGLSANDAISKSLVTLKLSRNANLDLAKAASIAANDVYGLTEEMLKTDTAMSDTASDAFAKLGKSVKNSIAEFYKRKEPMFIKWIDGLTKFMDNTLPRILDAAAGMLELFDKAIWPLKVMFGILEKMAKLMKGMSFSGWFKDPAKSAKEQLDALNESLQKRYKIIQKTKAEKIAETFADSASDVSVGPITYDYEVKTSKDYSGETENQQKMIKALNAYGNNYVKIKEKIEKVKLSSKELMMRMEQDIKNQVEGWKEVEKELATYRALLEATGDDTMMGPEKLQALDATIYKTLGIANQNYIRTLEKGHDDEALAFAQAIEYKIGRNEDFEASFYKTYAGIMKAHNQFVKDQMVLAPELKTRKTLFDAMGVSAKKYFTSSTTYHENQKAVLKDEMNLMFGLTEEGRKAYKEFKEYVNEQKKLKPIMDAYAQAFQITGVMANALYKNRIAQINHEIELMEKQGVQLDLEYLKRLKIQMLDREKEKPIVERHEAVFESTGKQSKYLGRKKEEYLGIDYDNDIILAKAAVDAHKMTWEEYYSYIEERGKKFSADKLEINRQYYQKDLADAEASFEATGIATEKYHSLYLANLKNLRTQALVENKGMQNEINAMYDKMERDFAFKIEAPKKQDYEDIYNETKVFSSKLKEMDRALLDAEYQYKKDRIGDSAELREWYLQRVLKLNVQELESHEDVCDGITAAFYRMYDDIEPLSKQIADDWVSMMQSMGDATHDYLIGMMENAYETWEDQKDALLGILRSIQRGFNEMVLDMIKSYAQKKLLETDIGKSLMDKFGAKKDPAAEKTAEAKATKSLAASELELAAAIQVKVAVLWELWAVQMALKALSGGGTWSGENATGAGTSTIRGGGGGGYGFQTGGKIEEEILGIGQKTKKKYSFGEHGTKEFVVPEDKMGSILAKHGDMTRADKIRIEEQMSGRTFEDPMANQNNTRIDNAKLASLTPQTTTNQTINNAPESISISVPVSIEGNAKLAGKMKDGVEQLIKDILKEEMR